MAYQEPELLDAHLGVLNDRQLVTLIRGKYVSNFTLVKNKKEGYKGFRGIDGSAIDLHLSNEAWEVSSTAKLKENQQVVESSKSATEKESHLYNEAARNGFLRQISWKRRPLWAGVWEKLNWKTGCIDASDRRL